MDAADHRAAGAERASPSGVGARTGIWLALITLGALLLRLQGIDYLLPQLQEPDAYVVRQAELLRSGAPLSPKDDAILRKYPLLTARLAALGPEPTVRAEGSLESQLAAAAAPTLRVRGWVVCLAVLAVPGTFLLARLWLTAGWSLVAAAWCAVNLLHVNYSQQARPHAVACTSCLLAVLAAIGMRRRPSLARSAAAGAAAGAALATLQFGVFALASTGAAWLLRAGRRRAAQWGGVVLGLALIVLAVLGSYHAGGADAELAPDSPGPSGVAFEDGALRIGSHRVPFERFGGGGFAKLAAAFWSYDPVALGLALVGLGALALRGLGRLQTPAADRWVAVAFGATFLLVLGIYSPTPAR